MATVHTTGFPRPLLLPRPRWWWVCCILFAIAMQVAMCAFWNYLQTGQWIDLSFSAMRNGLAAPISDTILGALSIFSYPWMLVVFGITLGLMLLIPLVMATLYPLWSSLLAAGALIVVAHNPIMGIVVAMGCVLVARNRWRHTHPYGALLLGGLPTGLLLQLLVFTAADTSLLLPMQRWILAIPFLLAMGVILLGGLLCFAIAHLRRLRPGVIWPCVLIMALPTGWVFFQQVGIDELHYALLLRGVEGGDVIFPAQPREVWRQKYAPRSPQPQLARRAHEHLNARRAALLTRCDAFLTTFPKSSRAPAIAWLAGQTQSLQLNHATLPALIAPTAAWPLEWSLAPWQGMVDRWPTHPAAALAKLQLARLQLRAIAKAPKPDKTNLKRAQAAMQTLQAARDQLAQAIAHLVTAQSDDARMGLFTPHTSLPDLDDYRQGLQATEELLWKIRSNDVLTDPACAWALSKLLCANPYALDYSRQLRVLQANATIKTTKLLDNVQMAIALQHADLHDRSRAMIALAKDERTDTAIEANYELGRIALQTSLAPSMDLLLDPSEEYFRKVVGAVDNPWTRKAANWLAERTPTESTPE